MLNPNPRLRPYAKDLLELEFFQKFKTEKKFIN